MRPTSSTYTQEQQEYQDLHTKEVRASKLDRLILGSVLNQRTITRHNGRFIPKGLTRDRLDNGLEFHHKGPVSPLCPARPARDFATLHLAGKLDLYTFKMGYRIDLKTGHSHPLRRRRHWHSRWRLKESLGIRINYSLEIC